jgi:hypothetical protein
MKTLVYSSTSRYVICLACSTVDTTKHVSCNGISVRLLKTLSCHQHLLKLLRPPVLVKQHENSQKHHQKFPCHDLCRDFGETESAVMSNSCRLNTSESKAIDDASLQGIYKLSHSWFIITITVLTNSPTCVRFEVFTTVTMKNAIFWDVMPCGSCKNLCFGGT